VLKNGDSLAEIVENFDKRVLKIRIAGKDRLENLAIIRHEVRNLHITFENLVVKEMVPCICEECKKRQVPNFFEYRILKQYKQEGVKSIDCTIGQIKKVNVLELISDVILKEEDEIEGEPKRGEEYGRDELPSQMKSDTKAIAKNGKWKKPSTLIPIIVGLIALIPFFFRTGETIPLEGKIELPKTGSKVDSVFSSSGKLSGVPDDRHIWLAIRVGNRYLPQVEINRKDQKWLQDISYDGKLGADFAIVLLAISKKSHEEIEKLKKELDGKKPKYLELVIKEEYSTLDIIKISLIQKELTQKN